jgi:hypothetical protein
VNVPYHTLNFEIVPGTGVAPLCAHMGMSFDGQGLFGGTPLCVGSWSAWFTVVDGNNSTDTVTLPFTVLATPPPPGGLASCCVRDDGKTACGNDFLGNPIPLAYPIARDGSLALGSTCTPPLS